MSTGSGQHSPLITSWHPGETVFSLVGRQHLLSCNSTAAQTCSQCFGHPRIGSTHDFPSNLVHFAHFFGGRLGDAHQIIRQHTLLPFYLPFSAPQTAKAALTSVVDTNVGALKSKLGLLASGFGAAHPLKACFVCMRIDRLEHHAAFWHVEHQLPGVWICPRHQIPLAVLKSKWMGFNRFGWIQPSEGEFYSTQQCHSKHFHAPELLELARASFSLWSLPADFHFDMDRLTKVYGQAMRDQNLSSPSGRIRTQEFGQRLAYVCGRLRDIPYLASLPHDAESAITQFTRLASGQRASRHPIKHLILSIALFRNWEDMWREYTSNSITATTPLITRATTDAGQFKSQIRLDFEAAILEKENSLRFTAARFGISIATATVWAASVGVEVKRRPKLLKPPIREKLLTLLRNGTDKHAAAEMVGVSVQTITTTLRSTPALHETWLSVRFERARENARERWRQAGMAKDATLKVSRSKEPAVYAWLYRNDRHWLEVFNGGLRKKCRSIPVGPDWKRRDDELHQRLQEAVVIWRHNDPGRHLSVARLCVLVPALRPWLGKLHKLPLSALLLASIPKPNNPPN